MERLFRPSVAIGRVPVHAMLVPFPIVCFTGAMLTDIVYARTAAMMWTNFSAWLLAFGMLTGVIAALFGMLDFLLAGPVRPRIGWFHWIGSTTVLVLALFNNFVHARDGWTSVVPTGLTLSILTVLALIVTGFLGHSIPYRHVAREVAP
ncbi:MAG: DUF2231 domain-containing protein [Croceibacterium sp.]